MPIKSKAKKATRKPVTNRTVPLVVTTEKKGVFFGYGKPTTAKEIVITKARMCVYWSQKVKGVVGLAATGPVYDCRVSLAIPKLHLREVTAVMECSPEAAAAWEKGPWQ